MTAVQQRESRKGGGEGREKRKGRREGRQGRGYILYTERALKYLHTILPLAKVKDIATNSGEFILCISQPEEL